MHHGKKATGIDKDWKACKGLCCFLSCTPLHHWSRKPRSRKAHPCALQYRYDVPGRKEAFILRQLSLLYLPHVPTNMKLQNTLAPTYGLVAVGAGRRHKPPYAGSSYTCERQFQTTTPKLCVRLTACSIFCRPLGPHTTVEFTENRPTMQTGVASVATPGQNETWPPSQQQVV